MSFRLCWHWEVMGKRLFGMVLLVLWWHRLLIGVGDIHAKTFIDLVMTMVDNCGRWKPWHNLYMVLSFLVISDVGSYDTIFSFFLEMTLNGDIDQWHPCHNLFRALFFSTLVIRWVDHFGWWQSMIQQDIALFVNFCNTIGWGYWFETAITQHSSFLVMTSVGDIRRWQSWYDLYTMLSLWWPWLVTLISDSHDTTFTQRFPCADSGWQHWSVTVMTQTSQGALLVMTLVGDSSQWQSWHDLYTAFSLSWHWLVISVGESPDTTFTALCLWWHWMVISVGDSPDMIFTQRFPRDDIGW